MTLRVHYILSLLLLLGAGCTGTAGSPAIPARPTPAATEATSIPVPTANQPAPIPTGLPERPTPIAEPPPEPTSVPEEPTPAEVIDIFSPHCDQRPRTDLPTQPHPETGEAWYLYANEAYGFSFIFPPEWELVEEQNALCLNYRPKPDIKFLIGFKWLDEQNVSIVRTGVVAGELVTTGELNFLGRAINRNVLHYEGKDRAILYDNAAHIRANELLFTLSVDDYSIPYEAVELTAEVMQAADAIVESFTLTERLYVNETYGFSFVLPPEWRLSEQISREWQNSVWLSYRPARGNVRFTIAFKWADEDDIHIIRTGVADTDEIVRGEITFLGQQISRDVFRYQGKDKAVLYAGAGHIHVNGRLFTLSLDYVGPNYLAGELPVEAKQMADAIVESFKLMSDRQSYYSTTLRFSIEIPGHWQIIEQEDGVYFLSGERYGDGPEPLAYYVYATEYANPEGRPFVEVATAPWSEAVRESFTYSRRELGAFTVYVTEDIPSRSGALTVFFERPDGYLAVALTPYDRQQPYEAQTGYEGLFLALLQTVQLR
jgi:hypothetical protein